MNELIPTEQSKGKEESGTNVGRFLAKRGLLLMRESREIGTVKCDYGNRIIISSLIISAASASLIRGETSFGVRFDLTDENGQAQGGAFLDLDELDELIAALNFVGTLAKDLLNQERDYTEVAYSTKDNMRFGFYQLHGQQQAFIDVTGYGNSIFISVLKLQSVRQTIENAMKHLLSRGAEA